MDNVFKTLELSREAANRIDPSSFILALLASLVSALVASLLYTYFYENRGTGSQVHRAFPLLGISITTLFLGVQMSLPLSLGLLGALSIVRFRTPIREPEEVGFIMLLIASSITCATFNFQLLIVLNLVAVLTLFALRGKRLLKHRGRDGMLILTMSQEKATEKLKQVCAYLKEHTSRNVLESSSTRDAIASIHFSFSGLKKPVEEVQSEIKSLAESQSIHIFFNRPGGIR